MTTTPPLHSMRDGLDHLLPRAANVLRWIDWFLPKSAEHESNEGLRRERLTVVTGFVAGLSIFGALGANVEPESIPTRIASYILVLFLLLAPIMLKLRVPARWIQNAMIAAIFAQAMTISVTTVGADTGGVFLAGLIPLFAILLCGARAGIAWSLLTCCTLALIAVVSESGFEAVVRPDPAVIATWNLWAGVSVIMMTMGVAITFEWLRESALIDLAEARAIDDRNHAAQHEAESVFRAQLERTVEERTHELHSSREQLLRADRLASIGTLAAGVAHEINNPVGAILLTSQFALLSAGSADREKVYRDALMSNEENAKRCGAIVKNLLRFSRSDSTEKTELDLNELVRNVVAGQQAHADRFDLTLIDGGLCVLASKIEIEQVVVNLMTNALQSGHPESKRIRISTERVDRCAVVRVTDEGRGIAVSDLERIYDPFFTTRINDGGTGLGLSLAHGIVQDHQGRIDVESQLGAGTRSSVSLPIMA